MFFFEWLLPLLALLTFAILVFFLAVRNRPGAGVRTEGKTVVDKPDETQPDPAQH